MQNGTACWAEFAAGFPASDIHDAGPAFLAYGRTAAEADAMIESLYVSALKAEADFDTRLLDPDEAVAAATAAYAQTGRPAVIADVQDNPGAGGTADTTGLVRALIRARSKGAIVGMINDPELAAAAHQAGVGAVIEGTLGGLGDGMPMAGRFRVDCLSDGCFPFTGEMYGGSVADTGLSAVLAIAEDDVDIRIVISSKRCQNLDQAIFTHAGIDPAQAAIIVVKSTVHFRADYMPIAGAVINAFAPGLHPCRLDEVAFRNIRNDVRVMPRG